MPEPRPLPSGAQTPPAPAADEGQQILAVVARNSAFVLGVQVLLKILAFLFNVYVVRRLGAAHFGEYSAVMAYVAIFSIFTDLGMATYSVRAIAEQRDRTTWLLPNMVAIRALLSLLVIGVAPLSAFLLGKEHGLVLGILVASAGQLIYAVQGPLSSVFTAYERLDHVSVSTMVSQLIFWALGVVLLLRGMGFIGLIVASLAGVAVSAVMLARILHRRFHVGRLAVSPRRWGAILRDAIPFGISDFSYVIMQRFDTVFMTLILSTAAVGWYNAPLALITMMLLLAQSIAVAIYPSMVRGYQDSEGTMQAMTQRFVKYLFMLSLPLAVGGTLLARPLIVLLYTAEFLPSVPVMQVGLWALPSLYLLELVSRTADTLHLERPAARLNLINAGLTVALNLVLIPWLGIVGGALALSLGRLVRLGQYVHLVGWQRLVGPQGSGLLRVAIAAALMGLGVYLARGLPLVAVIAIGGLLYGGLLLGLRAVDPRELRWLGRALWPRNRQSAAAPETPA
jgi:O-antigen/teichoic acid export membrane protein